MRKRAIEAKANITEDCLRSIKLVLERTLIENESLRKKLEAVTIENNDLRREIEDEHKRRKFAEADLKVAESEVFRLKGVMDIEQAEIKGLKDSLKIYHSYNTPFIKHIKADTISEFNVRIYAYKTGIYVKGEELIIIPVSDYDEILKELEGDSDDRCRD